MKRRIILAAALVVAALATTAPSASADCLRAEVWYSTNGGDRKHYIIGPFHCVTQTPFDRSAEDEFEHVRGDDYGVGVGVWLPLP